MFSNVKLNSNVFKAGVYEHIDKGKLFCSSSDEAVNQIGSGELQRMLWTPFMSRAYAAKVQPCTEQHDGYRVQHLWSQGQPVENHCMCPIHFLIVVNWVKICIWYNMVMLKWAFMHLCIEPPSWKAGCSLSTYVLYYAETTLYWAFFLC